MIRHIGVGEFRNHLKTYKDEVTAGSDTVIQVGPKGEAMLCLSPKGLERLQIRHLANHTLLEKWNALKLSNTLTLIDGAGMKDYSLDFILTLSKFMELISELLDLLARPGAKENAEKWQIQSYLNGDCTFGRFSVIGPMSKRLFRADIFENNPEKPVITLLDYFWRLKQETAFSEQFTKEEALCAAGIVTPLCELAIAAILFQTQDLNNQHPETLYRPFQEVEEWMQVYLIGEKEETL